MNELHAMRRVGVLGGMGPEATLAFLETFYAFSRGRREQERPPMIVDMDPGVPDRNAAWRGQGPSPQAAIVRMGRRLKRAGADFCVMPCATAHGFAENFEEHSRLPLLGLPETAVAALAETMSEPAPVGLLATTTTLEMGLFQRQLAIRSFPCLVPEATEQEILMQAIYATKQGRDASAEVNRIAEALTRRGAKCLLIGCTDLSVLPPPRIADCTLISALDALAHRTFAEAEVVGA